MPQISSGCMGEQVSLELGAGRSAWAGDFYLLLPITAVPFLRLDHRLFDRARVDHATRAPVAHSP